MAQFGTGKNPPWARAAEPMSQAGLQVAGLAGQQVGLTNAVLSQQGIATPTVYSLSSSQPTIQQQQYTTQQIAVASVQAGGVPGSAAVLPQPGIAIPTTLATTNVATVSYPPPRAAQTANQPKQRVFTGTVTKLHDNFGFVDEDVFFQTSSVKGSLPKVGDRVLVEATYNANMPFKWNATRIQVLPNQVTSFGRHGQTNLPPPNAAPPPQVSPMGGPGLLKPPGGGGFGPTISPAITPSSLSQPPPPLMGQHGAPPSAPHTGLLPPPGSRPGLHPPPGSHRGRPEPSSYRERDRDMRERRERHREERRERRSPAPRKRSRSPRRSRSPSSRSTRSPPRRRPPRIVPRYMVQIPKLSLDTKEANVITLRSRYTNLYIPSDFFNASFSWVEAFPLHRPFQLGHPCQFHVMHKEVESTETNDAVLEPSDADHLFSAKVMLMASPTLEELYHKSCALAEDASDVREAFQHPTRLVQFLVGLKGKSEPMAIGGPWSPTLDGPDPGDDPRVLIKTAIRTTRALTGIDLSSCTQWYRFAEIRYHRPEEVHKGRLVPARVETVVIFLPDVWSCHPSRLEWESLQAAYKQQLATKIAQETKEDQQEEEEDGDSSAEKKDPTHYSELDPRLMKVADLRRELECRNLSSKGLKSQLIARLTKAIKSEQEKEEQEKEDKEEEEEQHPVEEEEKKAENEEKEEEKKKKEEEERKRREERDRVARERRYNLPENPAIIVHPSPTAKSGKFDCTVMSLSVLLDYRPEDNKEGSFEVSLFAELFNEMLMRDFGFKIYKTLMKAPEKKEEEKEKKDRHKDKKDKDKDKDEKKDREKDRDKDKDEKKDKTEKDKEKEDRDREKEKDRDRKDDRREKKDDREEKSDEPSSKRRKTNSASDHADEDRKDDRKEKDKKVPREDSKDEGKEDDEEEEEEDEDNSSEDRDKDKRSGSHHKDKREKVKFFTGDPSLLMAFVYFDQSHTGYLLDRDVEEILHTIGLNLSRAQVKKLVQRLVSRDTLNYRKVTDRPLSSKEDKKQEEAAAAAVEEGAEAKDASDNKDDKDAKPGEEGDIPDDELLALGNNGLLDQSRHYSHLKDSPSGRTRSSSSMGNREVRSDSDSNMVQYKGALIDINSIMQRLEKSEKTRGAVEFKLKDLQEEMDELKESFSSSEQNSQKVALELQELKKKLRDQRRATEKSDSASRRYLENLQRSHQMLADCLNGMTEALGDRIKTEPIEGNTIKQEPMNGE